ncbi:hypothetical protein MNBD_PLANCTO02-2899, partial [hydrothermal vent metagenome]
MNDEFDSPLDDDTPDERYSEEGDIPHEEPRHEEPRHEEPHSEEVQQTHISAIVPERVKPGVFSTGVVVLQGTHEFIFDFILRMSSPHQVVARVVLPPDVVGRTISALGENLHNYVNRFGPIHMPASHDSENPEFPDGEHPQSAEDLYEELK